MFQKDMLALVYVNLFGNLERQKTKSQLLIKRVW